MLKRFKLHLMIIIASLILITNIGLNSCTHDIVDRGTVFPAVEQTLSLPGYNPVKDDLIKRGLVKLDGDGTQGYINVGQIEELVKENVYKIDENGYLQFGPSYTPAPNSSTPTPS